MRKTDPALNDAMPRPRRSLAPRAIALALALLAAPLLYEGGQVVLDRWLSMSGAHRVYRTPVLDALAEMSRRSTSELHRYSGRLFDSGSWAPRRPSRSASPGPW